ncbi:MAG: DUF881 domain-containing protein [Nakamurella sp.]
MRVVQGGGARARLGLSATRWRIGVLVICLIAGLLLGTARSYSQGEDIGNRSVDLSVVVQDAQRRVLTADATAAQLQAQVDAAAQGDVSPKVESVRAQVAELEPSAGLVPVTGPGLSVAMSDAPRDADGNYPAGVDPDDLVVHQQDVQSVVNALWAGGAEAMMIMDQRVLTTSAVRCIGNTLLLQGRTYSPPFVVTAIGDAGSMSAALDTEPGVQLLLQYVDKYQLGYEVNTLDAVELPAYDGTIRMASAREAR